MLKANPQPITSPVKNGTAQGKKLDETPDIKHHDLGKPTPNTREKIEKREDLQVIAPREIRGHYESNKVSPIINSNQVKQTLAGGGLNQVRMNPAMAPSPVIDRAGAILGSAQKNHHSAVKKDVGLLRKETAVAAAGNGIVSGLKPVN
jgi:hypothetical protein